MKEEKTTAEREKDKIEQELSIKTEELVETQSELEKTKKDKQQLEEEKNDATNEIFERTKEAEELKQQLKKEKEDSQAKSERIESLDKEKKVFEDQCKEDKKKITSLEQDKTEGEKTRDEQSKRIKELEVILGSEGVKRKHLEDDVSEKEKALAEEKKDNEEMKKKQEELMERIKKLEEENQSLKEEMTTLQTSDEEQDSGMKAETRYEMNNDMVNAPCEKQGCEKNVFRMARENCSTEEIKEMIEREGFDINGREEETNQTLLHIGAQTGNVELCKWLIEQGIDARAKDKNDNMAIHIASYYGKAEVVALLAEHDKETVNEKNLHGNTPLHCLVNGKDMTPQDRMDVFRVLKNHGADTTLTNKNKETILQRAIVNEGLNKGYKFSQDLINELVDDMKEQKASYANHRGETSLYTAAFFGNKQIVQALCGACACVSDADEEGWQPLHAAASRGYGDCCEILLDNGADVNSVTKKGTTPALVASQNGYVKVLEVLVSHHADLNKANEDGWCPIHGASVHGHIEVVKYLISCGVDVNVCENKHHHTPLMMCILSHEFNGEVEKALLGAGADWTMRSASGNTSLHACTVKDNVEAAQILVDYPDLKPPMNMRILTSKGSTVTRLCMTNIAPNLHKFLCDRLGERHPAVFSSQRRPSQTLPVPQSPPKPSASEAPGDTPRTNRRSLDESTGTSHPQTPQRPKSHNSGGNKPLTTSERRSTPAHSKKPSSPKTWK